VNVTRELLHRLPKADLHVHLDGSIRPATLIDLARAYRKPLPTFDEAALADHMLVRDARNLVDYLARFEITLSVLQTADALERAAYELAQDAAAENVRYMEVRYSPVLNAREALTMGEAVDASLRGLRRAAEDFGIRTSVIICALRHMDPATSVELAKLAVDFKDRGVVGFDLAGPEYDYPPKKHVAAFRLAAHANLALTVHAGEAFGPDSIRQAVHDCGANRVGHGTRLFEDADLMRYIKDFRIPLEVCLTSNVQTRAAATLADHPVRRYFDAGLVVTLNTDNRLMSGTTMTEEFARAHDHLEFGWDELCAIARMGFESAFLPWDEKRQLVQAVVDEVAALSGGRKPAAGTASLARS
jgi:adenosine deaminase